MTLLTAEPTHSEGPRLGEHWQKLLTLDEAREPAVGAHSWSPSRMPPIGIGSRLYVSDMRK